MSTPEQPTERREPEKPSNSGLAAPPHPANDPTKKTNATTDPTADDPGNGAD